MFDYHRLGGTPLRPVTGMADSRTREDEPSTSQPGSATANGGASFRAHRSRTHHGVFIIGVAGGTASGKTTGSCRFLQGTAVAIDLTDFYYRFTSVAWHVGCSARC